MALAFVTAQACAGLCTERFVMAIPSLVRQAVRSPPAAEQGRLCRRGVAQPSVSRCPLGHPVAPCSAGRVAFPPPASPCAQAALAPPASLCAVSVVHGAGWGDALPLTIGFCFPLAGVGGVGAGLREPGDDAAAAGGREAAAHRAAPAGRRGGVSHLAPAPTVPPAFLPKAVS